MGDRIAPEKVSATLDTGASLAEVFLAHAADAAAFPDSVSLARSLEALIAAAAVW